MVYRFRCSVSAREFDVTPQWLMGYATYTVVWLQIKGD